MIILRVMNRRWRLAKLAAAALLIVSGSEARAARSLLAELTARPPAAAGAHAALTSEKLEACLRAARALDASGQALDGEISAIEQITAESMFLQFVINSQFTTLNGADKAAVAEFEQRTRRHDELARKFKTDYPAYQQHKSDYDGKVAAFERDCAGDFDGRDLEAVKTKLQIK